MAIYRKPIMISINIMGGLGNELFMIFTTLAYGLEKNKKVVFPTNPYMGERHTYWHSFLKELTMFTTENKTNLISDGEVLTLPRFYEQGFHYTPLPYFESPILLFGYFQSPKYFDGCKDTIFKLIRLYDKQQDIRNRFAELLDGETISIHFRLGDYKTKRLHHAIMNYEYYELALEYILKNKPDSKRVLYCCESEDNEYVGQQIARLQERFPNLSYRKIPDGAEDYDQMLIMSCCSHNIIANSTFSWWAAYFNRGLEKIVCYPSVWFGEAYKNNEHNDLFPADWIQIQANPKHHTEPL
jgi:hypothetical protein